MATMRTLYCGLMRRPLHNHDGTAQVESTTPKTAQTYHARISVSIGLKSLDFRLDQNEKRTPISGAKSGALEVRPNPLFSLIVMLGLT